MSLSSRSALHTTSVGGARAGVRSALGQMAPMAGRLRPGLAADH